MKTIFKDLLKRLGSVSDLREIRVVKLLSPETSQALEVLRAGKVLILVLDRLELEAVRSIVNSLANYTATNGQTEWLGERTFLFAPRSCQIASTKPDTVRSFGISIENSQSRTSRTLRKLAQTASRLEEPETAIAAGTIRQTVLGPVGLKASWEALKQIESVGSRQCPSPNNTLTISPSRSALSSIEHRGVLRPSARTLRIKPLQTRLEELGDGLEMVLIPGGTFIMGSPETEAERSQDEGPQRSVSIASFSIGKYPVTQAQWQAVAALPQIERPLDRDPSYFKGADLPVEQVSWYDAVEFCARLSQKMGRQYRLPSEAEWEYACRAGTTTPFHFGETLNSMLANYDGRSAYRAGALGKYRQKTTPVGSVGVLNAFGLADLHGNVWEWCCDRWHNNYTNAPRNGRAWLTGQETQPRVMRGGSWYDLPRFCRSACRYGLQPSGKSNDVGFRVACSD